MIIRTLYNRVLFIYNIYMKNLIFEHFKSLFNENGFRLYMVGGTSRDYLLNIEILDYDFVTDATPNDVKKFLIDANFVFEKYGCVKTKYNGFSIDITTLREEKDYEDSRHPKEIIFTKDIKIDSLRRDFTINAIYIDENYELHDFHHGIKDLNDKVLKMIGDPDKRLTEDPLRILRAYRFATLYNLSIDKELSKSIIKNKSLLSKLNKDKVNEELNKLLKKV